MGPLELSKLLNECAAPNDGRTKRLRAAIRSAVATGELTAGEVLPSTRAAAAGLGMSRNSVQDAYEALVAEGVIKTARGRPPIILNVPQVPHTALPASRIRISDRGEALADNLVGHGTRSVNALSPGLPDPDLFPHDQWARILRRAARTRYDEAENYAEYHGHSSLRSALAKHLLQTRGVRVSPDNILITTGTQTAARLVTSLTTDAGDTALVEDPGYGGARAVLRSMGVRLRPLTDADLPSARLAYVTPSTQYPTGTRMPMQHRQSLLAWALRENAVILEDDYDSDFVWQHRDIPPLFALDQNQCVFMLGTASKSLLPSLRIGWLVLPDGMRDIAVRAHRTLGLAANLHVQSALAQFIDEGLYARHVRRTAEIYRERKDVLVANLKATLSDQISVSEPEGGLQLMVTFHEAIDDNRLVTAMRLKGYHPLPLSSLSLEAKMAGIVVGFAGATNERARGFSTLLAKLMKTSLV
ncbi:PLP-dependent aminotransferase family protein [Tateyamaria sp.]|uniref:MocR-like pyridoxine biosynthesis transcription factor PdxR n=1 Tax=Tateyamaria sp. TaxID=1929288 RepID=UPI00329C5B6D